MRLGNIKFSIQPEELDFKQFAIDTESQIIVSKKEVNSYVVAADLDKIEFKRDTIVALNFGEGKIWTGILKDLDIYQLDTNVFTIDFKPVLKARGFSIPSCRYRKRKVIKTTEAEETVSTVEIQPLIIESTSIKQPLVIETTSNAPSSPSSSVRVQSKSVPVPQPPKPKMAPTPKPTSDTLVVNGIKLKVKKS